MKSIETGMTEKIDEMFTIRTTRWLTRPQAATYTGYSPKTLANLASQDRGPAYRRFGGGRVLYELADLDSWIMAQAKRVA